MKGSFRLLRAFGVDINIHITFLVLPFLFRHYGLRGLFFILFVFLCVTLHELTHSLVARRFGITVREITLLPIGGLASMSSFPKKPSHEFLISISGPLFNIAFAAILYLPLLNILGPQTLFSPSLRDWQHTLAQCFWINLTLAAFNLLPAFPMDGGRVLRSLLARKIDYRRATSIAVNIGHIFALLFGYLGLIQGNVFLLAIAVFIYMAASAEGAQVDMREAIKRFRAKDVLAKELQLTIRGDAMNKVLVAPSILSADFSRLREEIKAVEEAGADWLHIDVMDGHFVPNITIGPVVVKDIKKATRLPLDVHLMIDEPERYIDAFANAGSGIITFHIEACQDPKGLIKKIKSHGLKAGASIKPRTSVTALDGILGLLDMVLVMTVEPGFGGQEFMEETLPKIRELKSRYGKDIEVDGGINGANAGRVIEAGANILVAGTTIFKSGDYKKAIDELKHVL